MSSFFALLIFIVILASSIAFALLLVSSLLVELSLTIVIVCGIAGGIIGTTLVSAVLAEEDS